MSCCDRHEPPIKLEADQRRIERWIEEIDQYNATPGNGTTRQYLTDVEWEARMYLRGEMERIGLVVEMDCMGNLIGTLPGTEPELAPVWTGSHFDTVLHGGRFDGVAGVVAGMEALKLIADSGGGASPLWNRLHRQRRDGRCSIRSRPEDDPCAGRPVPL